MVENGTEISVWNDPWLSHYDQQRPFGPAPERFKDLKVSDLLQENKENTKDWDAVKLELILPFHKEQILWLQLSKTSNEDELVWLKNPNGEYTTRSGYLVLTEERSQSETIELSSPTDWLANAWKVKIEEKVKFFIWKSLHGALPVGEQFAIRNIHVSPLCIRCKGVETVTHLLFTCPFAAIRNIHVSRSTLWEQNWSQPLSWDGKALGR